LLDFNSWSGFLALYENFDLANPVYVAGLVLYQVHLVWRGRLAIDREAVRFADVEESGLYRIFILAVGALMWVGIFALISLSVKELSILTRLLPFWLFALGIMPLISIALSYVVVPLFIACAAAVGTIGAGLAILDCLVVGWSHKFASKSKFKFVLSQPFIHDIGLPFIEVSCGLLLRIITYANGLQMDDMDLGPASTLHVGIHGLRGAILHESWPDKTPATPGGLGWSVGAMIVEETLENLSDILVALSNPSGFFSILSIAFSCVDALAEIGIQTGTAQRKADSWSTEMREKHLDTNAAVAVECDDDDDDDDDDVYDDDDDEEDC